MSIKIGVLLIVSGGIKGHNGPSVGHFLRKFNLNDFRMRLLSYQTKFVFWQKFYMHTKTIFYYFVPLCQVEEGEFNPVPKINKI